MACPICFEEYDCKDCSQCRLCNQRMHKECLSRWLEIGKHCPLCRVRLRVSEDDVLCMFIGFLREVQIKN